MNIFPPPGNCFIGCDAPFDKAQTVLFGAPFDSTTSYRPGARQGPDALRRESFGIETYSPIQDLDLADDADVADSGDLELPFGAPERPLEMIEERAAAILSAGKIPYLLGGEHLVTLGAVRAALKRFPDLEIVHFDAHADLREDYLGNPLSHATVIRRCLDLTAPGRIHQFGIRSGTREEFALDVDRHPFGVAAAADLRLSAPVYLTVDMDVLDPSEFPGTGTPEAGGAHYGELLKAVCAVIAHNRVVALDMVELAPMLDPTGRSTALACKYLRETLLALSRESRIDQIPAV